MRHGGCVTYAEFSPDGGWVVTGSSVDDRVCLWPVIETPVPAPGWLPELAEAIAGQRIHETEVSEVISVANLYQLRQKLLITSQPGFYNRWARWFFSENHRPLTPTLLDLPSAFPGQ